ncbi:MAG: hypothetical protein V3V96_14260 [Acidiferrobacterales bacterium]
MEHVTCADITMHVRVFPLRVLLTVTTGRLLTEPISPTNNGIGVLYEILAHMTGDSPFTHTLGRFAEECKPWLLRWYPQLSIAEARLDEFHKPVAVSRVIGVDSWLAELEGEIGSTFDVGRIPADDHEHKHPYDELVIARGTDEGIIIANVLEQ